VTSWSTGRGKSAAWDEEGVAPQRAALDFADAIRSAKRQAVGAVTGAGGDQPRFATTRRAVSCASLAILFTVMLCAMVPARAADPVKVGFSMALTGAVAPNGKQNLLALEIWRDDVNAKGGLLGRPVELVYYDDQSNPNNVPGIYTKLISVDKVDLLQARELHACPQILDRGRGNRIRKDGEWTKSRQFFTQFQGVSGNDLAQFCDTTHQVILWPPEYKTGNIIYPYQDAKKK